MAQCKCDGRELIVDPPPPSSDCEDCLYVTSPIVACENGVGPCGETGVVALVSNCDNPIYTILSYSSAFENVTIVDDVLGYDTVDEIEAVPNTYYEICYKVTCADDPFAGLSVIGCARICIKNLCSGISCEGDEVCDPCTGECGPAQLNLGLNIN